MANCPTVSDVYCLYIVYIFILFYGLFNIYIVYFVFHYLALYDNLKVVVLILPFCYQISDVKVNQLLSSCLDTLTCITCWRF